MDLSMGLRSDLLTEIHLDWSKVPSLAYLARRWETPKERHWVTPREPSWVDWVRPMASRWEMS